MHYAVFSFSHKNVDIAHRDKLAFLSHKSKTSFLSILLAHDHIKEAILLSTCNRTEFFIYTSNVDETNKFLLHELSFYCSIQKQILETTVEGFADRGAIEHMFKVASSLESIVVGETQITGQLKDAYRFSLSGEFCSQNLSKVVHYAFKCAASVRNKTKISKDNTSVVSVALNEINNTTNIENKKILIIGAGDMSRLAIKYFVKYDCDITLVNRTLDNAQILAQEFELDIKVVRFDNIKSLINQCDILFTATSSPTPIITKKIVKETSFTRYWFDMALPQDIESFQNDNIISYNIDSLKKIVEKTKESRAKEANLATNIVKDFVERFLHLQQQSQATHTIKNLKQKAKNIYLDEIEYALKKGYLQENHQVEIEKILDRAFSKFLHNPLVSLKKIANKHTQSSIGNTVDYLFANVENINLIDKDFIENNK